MCAMTRFPCNHSSFVRSFEISVRILLDIADARDLTAKDMVVFA